MKKTLLILGLAVCAAFTACKKDEIGGTATEALAGEWVVLIDAVDASGQIVYEDPFGMGESFVYTYNTSANKPDVMFLDDQGEFWEYKCKVNCNAESLTFSASGAEDLYNGISVDVSGGKITLGGATSPSGMPVDAIEFYITFSDDDYVGNLYDKLYIHGYRYTGFAADEP